MMVMGAFVPGLRRKYPIHEYISAILLVIGLIIFTLADANTSPNFSILGVMMISGALIMDAFLGNVQEAIFTMNPDTTQVIFQFLYIKPLPVFQMHSRICDGTVAFSICNFLSSIADYRQRCCSAQQ